MDMVRHKAVAKQPEAKFPFVMLQELKVAGEISIFEKYLLLLVSPIDNVVAGVL
jgi:hypothetical protein